MRRVEWRMRDIRPPGGDVTGNTTGDATLHDPPMDTSEVNRVADELFSQADAGGSGGGGGDGLQQQEMLPPPAV